MTTNLKHITVVALSTVGSRVLGLVRDILVVTLLGYTLSSVFVIAFTIPNLSRRLLGEGALTSALIPVMTTEQERAGKEQALALFNQVLSRLTLVLLGLTALGWLLLAALPLVEGLPERWYAGARLTSAMLPYMVLACLSAVFAAGLNVMRRFGIAALSQVWLNLSMIFFLGVLGTSMTSQPEDLLPFLAAGVLFGGLIQLLVPAFAFRSNGWRPKFELRGGRAIKEIWRLLLPGLAGAAIFQINIAVSRLIAFAFHPDATSILYLANRLIELPLGIFAVTVTTVVFPTMSAHAARGEMEAFGREFHQGQRFILAITFPAAIGLILLGGPIVELLFQWGRVGAEDISMTVPVLVVLSVGLPFYALASFYTRGFHSMMDMKTPVRLAALNFVVNIGLTLLLIQYFGITGFALANVSAMVLHAFLMGVLLFRKLPALRRTIVMKPFAQMAMATVVMAVVVFVGRDLQERVLADSKAAALLIVVCMVPLGVAAYGAVLKLLRFEELEDVIAIVFRRKAKPSA